MAFHARLQLITRTSNLPHQMLLTNPTLRSTQLLIKPSRTESHKCSFVTEDIMCASLFLYHNNAKCCFPSLRSKRAANRYVRAKSRFCSTIVAMQWAEIPAFRCFGLVPNNIFFQIKRRRPPESKSYYINYIYI